MASSIGAVFDALANPTRHAILDLLGDGERAVGCLADELPVTRPAVSQHLRVLRNARLVIEKGVGTRHVYSLAGAGFAIAREYLERVWSQRS